MVYTASLIDKVRSLEVPGKARIAFRRRSTIGELDGTRLAVLVFSILADAHILVGHVLVVEALADLQNIDIDD